MGSVRCTQLFESGFRMLHTYITLLSIAVFSLWIMIAVFIIGVVLDLDTILVNPIFYILLFVWLCSASIGFTLCAFIRCHYCNKRLAVITKSDHQVKNKHWVLWFLKGLPPQIKCEHCGVLYQGTPNKPLKQDK